MPSLPSQLRNLLKQVDLFSIPVPVLTHDTKSQYSSSYSGIISILASVLSLAYFFFIISEWVNGKIHPNITINQQAQAYSEQNLEDNFIQFKLTDPTNHDPFKRKNNIITPLLFAVENFQIVTAPTPFFSDENQPFTVGLKKATLVLNSLNNKNDDPSHKPQKNYLLIFIECLDQYLDDNSNCASQEEIDQYMSEYHGFLSIIMSLEQYNYQQDKLEMIKKQAYQALSPSYIQYTQINIQQKEIKLDDGMLVENLSTYNLINDFQITNQSIDNQYVQKTVSSFSTSKYEFSTIFSYQISIDNLKIVEKVIKPKLNQVLASIGSIVQVIFFLKYLAIFINNQQFKDEMQTEILHMYYPNLKNVKVKKSILGKIISFNRNNEDNKSQALIKQYEGHLEIAFKKLRIELLFEKHFGLQKICDCSQLGSEFQLVDQEKINESARAYILTQGNQSPQPKEDIFRLFNIN